MAVPATSAMSVAMMADSASGQIRRQLRGALRQVEAKRGQGASATPNGNDKIERLSKRVSELPRPTNVPAGTRRKQWNTFCHDVQAMTVRPKSCNLTYQIQGTNVFPPY